MAHEDLIAWPEGTIGYEEERRFLEFVDANRDLGFGRMMALISQMWRKEDPAGALTVALPDRADHPFFSAFGCEVRLGDR